MHAERPPALEEYASPDLIAAAAVGIVSVDADARILSANAAALDMLRCAESDALGRRAHDVLNGRHPAGDCELEAAVRAGRPVQFEEDTFFTRDGRPLPVWWAVNPMRDQFTGALAGAVLVFGNSTAQRKQDRVDLAEAQQNIADLEWAAVISQALSLSLDEIEVMQRLARLTVGRLADVVVADLITDEAVIRRVGSAVADGVDLDVERVLAREDIAADFEPQSATYRLVTATELTEITPEQMRDPDLLSVQSRAMLEEVGATHALAVPLIARGHTVGALGLMRLAGSPPFDEMDKLAAVDVCLRAALAVDNARLYRAQTDISTRLQRALLPALPEHTSVHAAVRYLPARDRFDVGGDWYDLFRSPHDPDTNVLVVGDVAGHDLAAGTTMSALRNLLRGITVVTDDDPAGVLRLVDDNLDALGIRGTATVLIAYVSPLTADTWRVRWSNAGHMPLLALTPDGGAEMIDDVHGSLLGTGIQQVRGASERIVRAGTTLVLYTDGLVETREETIDAGLARLRHVAGGLTAPLDDPEAIADELLAGNHASVEDDTAMLVCHLPALDGRQLRS